jgi:hypothetical protein
VEPLLHFSLAFAVLCAFGVEPGVAFPASLFALSPDLDVLLGFTGGFFTPSWFWPR